MQFRSLRLVGFKSFVEPTEFVIERGLTGVVGPNGCGKSNLVEALRWVMGEASYKNMRASAMDDVIFSGSAHRPARNFAEVGLMLDNADRRAPAAFNDADELQVTRRIEREAGSVYRINGREARARDVQLLFADVSTGARSPSMIGQGRVSELIAAKPTARRALLEEAAGISGLHTRRHEAELRLRATETNLERLDDLIGQLETRLDALKRQSRQAARYRNVAGDIAKVEAIILHLRWRAAVDAMREADGDLTAATVAAGEAGIAQAEAARIQALIAHDLPALRQVEAEAGATLAHARIARDQLDREEAAARKRRAEIEARVSQLADDIAREERLVAENADILAHLARERETLGGQAEGHDERLAEATAAFETAHAKASEAEMRGEAATAALAEAVAVRRQGEKALADARQARQRAEGAARSAHAALAKLVEEIEATSGLAERRARLEEAESDAATSEAESTAAETRVEETRGAEEATRGPLADLRSRSSALDTEARTLAKVLATDGDFTPVLDELDAEPGYERALAVALGADLDAPRDEDAASHWGGVGRVDDPQLPDGARPLSEMVRAPKELSRRLAQIGVVDALAAPDTLAPGQCFVTREGALVRWDGFIIRADAATPAALRLEQRNRLVEVEAERDEVQVALTKAETVHEEAREASAGAQEQQKRTREAVRRARSTLDAARNNLAQAERRAAEAETRRVVLEADAARRDTESEEAARAVEAAEGVTGELPDTSALSRASDEARRLVAETRSKAAEARDALEAVRREGAARDERLAAIDREEATWRERVTSADHHMERLRDRLHEARAERDAVEAEPDAFEAQRRIVLNAVGEAEERRSSAADRLAARESDLREADKAARDTLTALSNAREAVARAEARHEAAAERRSEAEARIREALGCEPHMALSRTGLPEEKLPAVADAERRLERLRAERERLGAVNLQAETESNEVEEERDRIVAERDDLIAAIAKLRHGIGQLNREGRERLLEAFDKVSVEFTRLFTHLFGGGTAELKLIESDDPLEAGLEIVARPPGKKPQVMTLLSGGEQALTAMALIFAVFLTNPAPICVLDEVDAPLDDHNVERFCNLMDEMAANTATRFVIVTHNPITMARMNRLFGVTMAEKGVSQLVSVDLEAAEVMAEAG